MTQRLAENESETTFTPGIPAHQVTLEPPAPSIGRFAQASPLLSVPRPVPAGYGSWRQYRDHQALKSASNEDTYAGIIDATDDLLSDDGSPYTSWYVQTMQMYYLAGALRRQKRLVMQCWTGLVERIDADLDEAVAAGAGVPQ